MLYLTGIAIFSARRSLEHFWSASSTRLASCTRCNHSLLTVVERNTLLYSWSLGSANGVFLYNRLLWAP